MAKEKILLNGNNLKTLEGKGRHLNEKTFMVALQQILLEWLQCLYPKRKRREN